MHKKSKHESTVYPRPKSPTMIQREKAVLSYIKQCKRRGEPSPSIREIMEATNISSSSMVVYTLDELEANGYITRHENKARSIQLVGKSSNMIEDLSDILEPLISMDNLIPDWTRSDLFQFRSQLMLVLLLVKQMRFADGKHDELIYILKTVIDRLAHLCEDKLTERTTEL